MQTSKPSYYEFFAGGGMARAGLGREWQCVFANDFDTQKCSSYAANWGNDHLVCGDVAKLRAEQLPGRADLAWASFPCQDLSLAGDYLGLGGERTKARTRSGTFWPFWALMRQLGREGRGPRLVVLENVFGVLTSRQGRDFSAICSALSGSSYRFGAVVVDAAHFVPQSRPRVFFVAVHAGEPIAAHLETGAPIAPWHPTALQKAYGQLSDAARRKWVWWNLPQPTAQRTALVDLIDTSGIGTWHTPSETAKLLSMMSPANRAKVRAAQQMSATTVGCIYKRTRLDENGEKCQRAEVRFDGLAGCLRTPGGGSSRQTMLVVQGNTVRSRLLATREAARLMGLPDSYELPANYNAAYKLVGDGVCVPAVRFLANALLEPLLKASAVPSVMAFA